MENQIINFINDQDKIIIINIFGVDTIFIKDEKFRNLFGNFIVIKDEEFAKRQARLFYISAIMDENEDLDGDELFEKIENYPLKEEINSLLVLPYVDHQAGLSFQTVAACLLEEDKLLIYERPDNFENLSNIRLGAAKDFEFEYLENLKVPEDFDFEPFQSHSMETFKHYNDDDKILTLRVLTMLDEYRNEQHPDDILVFFFKEALAPEGMWVRYEDFNEEQEIFGRLLNQPNQDFGVNMGDTVKFSFAKNQDGALICVCDLDK